MVSNILKYILGFLLAIAILFGSGFAVALYLMNRTSIPPEKPIFSNDKSAVKANSSQRQVKKEASKNSATNKKTSPAKPEPTPEPDESPEILPPGAYKARVTWPQGLSIRETADINAKRIGYVAFNRKVIVLEESPDKAWQRIRIDGSEQEGWVKSGNTKAVDE
ncbi:MAG: SH3 domain-containing protein [Richelia sp.]|nr:SH3 domain-containing protein [Richelia sp.]